MGGDASDLLQEGFYITPSPLPQRQPLFKTRFALISLFLLQVISASKSSTMAKGIPSMSTTIQGQRYPGLKGLLVPTHNIYIGIYKNSIGAMVLQFSIIGKNITGQRKEYCRTITRLWHQQPGESEGDEQDFIRFFRFTHPQMLLGKLNDGTFIMTLGHYVNICKQNFSIAFSLLSEEGII